MKDKFWIGQRAFRLIPILVGDEERVKVYDLLDRIGVFSTEDRGEDPIGRLILNGDRVPKWLRRYALIFPYWPGSHGPRNRTYLIWDICRERWVVQELNFNHHLSRMTRMVEEEES